MLKTRDFPLQLTGEPSTNRSPLLGGGQQLINDMMLADEMNGSRLWAFLALPLGSDKAYLMTGFDAVKCIAAVV